MLKVTGLLSRNLWWMLEESWNQNSRSECEKTRKSKSFLYLSAQAKEAGCLAMRLDKYSGSVVAGERLAAWTKSNPYCEIYLHEKY